MGVLSFVPVKNSKDKRELEAYISQYPNGAFAQLAKLRLERMNSDDGLTAGPGDRRPRVGAAVRNAVVRVRKNSSIVDDINVHHSHRCNVRSAF
jgi:hypothetical protein